MGSEVPHKILRVSENLNFGLKFSVFTPLTLELLGVTSQNFTTGCSSWPGDKVYSNFARGAPNKLWEGTKRPKFAAISDNFRLWARIPPKRINITKTWNVRYQLQILHSFPIERKTLVVYGIYKIITLFYMIYWLLFFTNIIMRSTNKKSYRR